VRGAGEGIAQGLLLTVALQSWQSPEIAKETIPENMQTVQIQFKTSHTLMTQQHLAISGGLKTSVSEGK